MRTVQNVMHGPVVALQPHTTVAEANGIARGSGVRHFPIVLGPDLVGVVCLCDFEDASPASPVGQWMSRPVLTVVESDGLDYAAALMRDALVGCLPVLRDRVVVGIVTRGDLLRQGVPSEVVGAHRCSSCGTLHDVRPSARLSELFLCLDCRDRAAPPRDTDDLGQGD